MFPLRSDEAPMALFASLIIVLLTAGYGTGYAARSALSRHRRRRLARQVPGNDGAPARSSTQGVVQP